jgi:hypothetical protein
MVNTIKKINILFLLITMAYAPVVWASKNLTDENQTSSSFDLSKSLKELTSHTIFKGAPSNVQAKALSAMAVGTIFGIIGISYVYADRINIAGISDTKLFGSLAALSAVAGYETHKILSGSTLQARYDYCLNGLNDFDNTRMIIGVNNLLKHIPGNDGHQPPVLDDEKTSVASPTMMEKPHQQSLNDNIVNIANCSVNGSGMYALDQAMQNADLLENGLETMKKNIKMLQGFPDALVTAEKDKSVKLNSQTATLEKRIENALNLVAVIKGAIREKAPAYASVQAYPIEIQKLGIYTGAFLVFCAMLYRFDKILDRICLHLKI